MINKEKGTKPGQLVFHVITPITGCNLLENKLLGKIIKTSSST